MKQGILRAYPTPSAVSFAIHLANGDVDASVDASDPSLHSTFLPEMPQIDAALLSPVPDEPFTSIAVEPGHGPFSADGRVMLRGSGFEVDVIGRDCAGDD